MLRIGFAGMTEWRLPRFVRNDPAPNDQSTYLVSAGSSRARVVDILGIAFASGNNASLGGHETLEQGFSCLSVESVLRQILRYGICGTALPLSHLLSKVLEGFLMTWVTDDIVELMVVTADVEKCFGRPRRTKNVGLGRCEFAFGAQTKQVLV